MDEGIRRYHHAVDISPGNYRITKYHEDGCKHSQYVLPLSSRSSITRESHADDGRKLFNDFGIVARNLVELGGLAQQADKKFVDIVGSRRQIVALATVVHTYTHKVLGKGPVRSSNWEAELSEEQLECTFLAYILLAQEPNELHRDY